MAGPVSRLRVFIRDWFTHEAVSSEMPKPSTQDTTRKKPRRRYRTVVPSERFVWGIVAVIVALVGLIALEAVCIAVTGAFNSEVFSGISGIVTGLVTVFVTGKRRRKND
jgi:sorbitol-specific phosphotransferase system component IIC